MRLLKVITFLAFTLTTSSCIGVGLDAGYYSPAYVEPSYSTPRYVEALPAGSYLDTCRECRISSSSLSCACKNVQGGWLRSSLYVGNCRQSVHNDNGRLKCGPAVVIRPVEERLPSGSYLQSCNSCRVQNGSLSCSCANERGNYMSTSLYVRNCNQNVSNQDGRLTCGAPRYTPAPMPVVTPLPAGSYKQSCSSCTNSGGTLSCMCQNENGSNVRTSTSSYCSQDISNQNGRLTCGTPARPRAVTLPRGSYQQSCQSCQVSNDNLSCNCANENGTYRSTSLSLGGCYSSIENCNGRLSCGNC